jgi:sugar phosphate isomerase/epimerase
MRLRRDRQAEALDVFAKILMAAGATVADAGGLAQLAHGAEIKRRDHADELLFSDLKAAAHHLGGALFTTVNGALGIHGETVALAGVRLRSGLN